MLYLDVKKLWHVVIEELLHEKDVKDEDSKGKGKEKEFDEIDTKDCHCTM